MDFKIKKQLTNTRPPKSTIAELVTAPTKGIIRLSDSAATAMDVSSGDYVAVFTAELNGEDVVVACKGHKGENGESNFGSKAAGSNGKDTGTLQFSSSNTWQILEGDADTKSHWEMDVENVQEEDGVKYFVITKTHTSDKMSRGEEEDEVVED